MIRLLLLTLLFLLPGCATVHFTHDLPAGRQPAQPLPAVWHDTTVDGMIEISPPQNLYVACQGRPWQQVTVEYTFSNGLTSAAVTTVGGYFIPLLGWISLYSPWTVQTVCGR